MELTRLVAVLAVLSLTAVKQVWASQPLVLQTLASMVPLDSRSELRSALGWKDCLPKAVYQPTSTDQVADIVMNLHEETVQTNERFLVRATHNNFFSHNNFSCPHNGLEGTHTVVIDMTAMNQVLQWGDDSITVQAGITFKELNDQLLEHGLSLPGVVMAPHFAGMSIGGALVTAAHGSSLVGPSTLGPYLTQAIMVDGTGQVFAMEAPGDLLEGSLGLLGIVTEVTLVVGPAQKVAVRQYQEEDIEMVADLRELIEDSDAVALDVTWNPTAGMYTARVWHEVDNDTPGEAINTWMHASQEWLETINTKLEQDQQDVHERHGVMCEMIGELTGLPYFSSLEGEAYDMSVGWLNHMSSVHCPDDNCFWQRAKWTPYEFSIVSEDFAAWVEDVRDIIAHARSCPSFLFHFRFVLESEAFLAMNSGKQVVAVEISTHSSRTETLPVKHQALFEEIVQMTMCKYEGRPHWALSTNRMFASPCPVRDMYGGDFDSFLEERQQYDPQGLFLHPLFTRIINRGNGTYYPGCALSGECFCTEDQHCGAGHICTTGRVFTEYKVCRPQSIADEL